MKYLWVILLNLSLLNVANANVPELKDYYMACEIYGVHVGYLKLELQRKTDRKNSRVAWELEMEDRREYTAFGLPTQERYTWEARLAEDLSLVDFSCKMLVRSHPDFNPTTLTLSGEFDADGKGKLSTSEGTAQTIAGGGPIHLFALLGLGDPSKGKVRAIKPYYGAIFNAWVETDPSGARKVFSEFARTPVQFKLDEAGRPASITQREDPFLVEWKSSDRKTATAKPKPLTPAEQARVFTQLTETSITPRKPIPEPERARRVVLSVKLPVPFDVPSDGHRQKVEQKDDGALRVTLDAKQHAPFQGEPTGFLGSDLFINPEHRRVKAAAESVVESAGDDAERAALLTHAIYRKVQYENRPGLPVASDALKYSAGDCTEHSTIYAAMARAVGLPCRIVAGLIYRDGQFRYHAWNEVVVEAKPGEKVWLPQDPSLGLSEVDATHFKLVEGNVDKQLKLDPLLGDLKIEVLEAR